MIHNENERKDVSKVSKFKVQSECFLFEKLRQN